jgi:hypothetical protein
MPKSRSWSVRRRLCSTYASATLDGVHFGEAKTTTLESNEFRAVD